MVLILAGIVGLRRGAPTEPAKPVTPVTRPTENVVLIVLDALRADRVNAERNGVPVMPYLARFAGGCVRFTDAVTPCTWTRPAMASIFTSLYVDTHQVYFSADPRLPKETADALAPSLETMAAYLQKAGYTTLGVQTNGNLVRELGFAQGFDQYDYLPEAPAGPLTARAIERTQNLAEPFFLYVHYLDPHLPYTPPESYRKLLGFPDSLDPAERAIVLNFMDYFWDFIDVKIGAKSAPTFTPLSKAGREAVRTLYDGEARYLDDELGKLVDHLQARYKNTLFILTADHGESLWDHDYLGHGLTMYQEELEVPFLVRGPGIEPRAVDRVAETLDILPTVAALLGLPPNPAWQGSSLFAGDTAAVTSAFSYTRGPFPSCNTDREMVQVGNWKLIRDRSDNRAELYDVAADPQERTDLASQRPKIVEQFQGLLDTHREENIRARGQNVGHKVQLDPAILEQIRKLGYKVNDE